MGKFPSLKAKRLLAILMRAPLDYRILRQKGSHRRLVSPRHPPITFAFHDRYTVPPTHVRKVLVQDVGLSEEEALKLL